MVLSIVWLDRLWFGSHNKFWISMTELFVTMNSFTITEGSGNQWIYQWICDIQIIWKFLRNFAEDHCFWTPWTQNYVGCIPFSCIDYFQILLSNYQKTCLNLQLCRRGSIKLILFIYPSVCPSVCDVFSSGSTLWIF